MTSNLFNLGINSFRIIDRPGKHLTLQKVAMPSGTKKDKKEVRKDEVRTVLTVLLDPLFLDLVDGACGMSNYFTLRLSHSRLKRKMPLGMKLVTSHSCHSCHLQFSTRQVCHRSTTGEGRGRHRKLQASWLPWPWSLWDIERMTFKLIVNS